MGTRGKRSGRWPRATTPVKEDELDARATLPFGVRPLVVAETVRPSRWFRNLAVALGLPEPVARFVLMDVLDDPDATPEALTSTQLLSLGPTLLRTIDTSAMVPDGERRAAHLRVEALLHAIANRPV
jgi:hypothetical protein